MATTKTLTPTNQTISIPELTDAPDISVPADAIDKEADAINTLNSNIAKVLDSTTISGSTLAEVQTNLVTLISGMSDLSVRQIKFTLTSSTGQIESATYYGKVTRHNSTIAIVEIQSIAAIGDNSCIGTWRNSAWSWNRLALNEQIAIKNLGSLNSMNDLKTALNNLAQSSGDFSIVYFKFYPNFTDSDAGFYADSYGERIGYVNVRQSSRFNAIITYQNGTVTRMANNNGTWKVCTVVTSEQIGTLLKRVIYTSNNLTISANGYAKVCNYSDLGTGVTYNNIVSVERYSSNMTGATWFEVYSDGIYIYSTSAQTNKWVKLNVVITSLNIPETIIN